MKVAFLLKTQYTDIRHTSPSTEPQHQASGTGPPADGVGSTETVEVRVGEGEDGASSPLPSPSTSAEDTLPVHHRRGRQPATSTPVAGQQAEDGTDSTETVGVWEKGRRREGEGGSYVKEMMHLVTGVFWFRGQERMRSVAAGSGQAREKNKIIQLCKSSAIRGDYRGLLWAVCWRETTLCKRPQ